MKFHLASLPTKIVILFNMGLVIPDKSQLALEVNMTFVEITTRLL
jgi:hypothetical protein